MRNFIHYNELNEAMNCKSSEKNNIVPGMCATMFCGSDRYAMVVIMVNSPKTIRVSHIKDTDMNKIVEKDGIQYLPENVVNEYILNDHPDKYGYWNYHTGTTYTLRKNGRWMPKGFGMWQTSSIHIGQAENYRDPSF